MDEPLKTAWDILRSNKGYRIIPITSPSGEVKGIVSLADIASIFLEVPDEELISHHEVLYKNLTQILGAVAVGSPYAHDKLCGRLFIGTNFQKDVELDDKDVVITSEIEAAWHMAFESKVGCIILTNGLKPVGLERADCAVLCVEYTIFKTISLISQAISLRSVMYSGDIITFSEENYLDDISDIMRTSRHRNFPVVNSDGMLNGIISRRHLMDYSGKKVILVDHNEKSQSVDGLVEASIIEIIDHHRVADIHTEYPLYIRAEPVGCSSTIIFKMYKESKVSPPKEVAGLMLSAILSDTLMFSSPTCTQEDKAAAAELADIAEVDIQTYGRAMFEAGSSLQGLSPNDILATDRKRFTLGNNIAYISQINTLDFKSIMSMSQEITACMELFYQENECSLVMLIITDIVAGGSEIMAIGKDKDLLEAAFGVEHGTKHFFLPGVVSRKQQIVPKLTNIATRGII